ncbi:MAG: hypothetical protein VZR00_01175, partial [Lachnospiraceae bacterium]|nr:hypothetical protein [Lachnospiraceae bacterium]
MKKIIFNVGTLLMIIGVFSACDKKAVSFNENNEVEISEEKDRNNFVNSEDVNNEKDQTGTATESTNDNDAGIDINKFNNIEKISSECDYAISSDLQDMSSSAQEIVEGKIAEIKYVAIDGDPWTKISLQIQNCLSGSLNEGDVITL